LILQRQQTKTHVLVKDLPEEFRFTRLLPERKYFLDTIKMISYRAEISMALIVREKLARSVDAHALLRQIFETEVDLVPDATQQTLTVRMHHLTQRAPTMSSATFANNSMRPKPGFPAPSFGSSINLALLNSLRSGVQRLLSTPARRADTVSERNVGKSACATSLHPNTCEKYGLERRRCGREKKRSDVSSLHIAPPAPAKAPLDEFSVEIPASTMLRLHSEVRP
jgi:hypothetical protein